MSTIKADTVTTKTDDTDLTITGHGAGVPNLEAGFKVGGVAGVPTASIQDDAVTLAKMASVTDGNLITYDASGNPAHVATGTSTHVLTSNGAGAAPTFQAVSAAAGIGAFGATITAGSLALVRATYTTITGWTELTDPDGAFNNTTGTFTAPSAGKYLFIANAEVDYDGVGDDGEATFIRFFIATGEVAEMQYVRFPSSNPYGRYLAAGTSALIDMAASATIVTQVMALDADAVGGNASLERATFSGLRVV